MADITVSIVIPNAYVTRLQAALDYFDAAGAGSNYIPRFKDFVKRHTKAMIYQAEINTNVTVTGDDLLS